VRLQLNFPQHACHQSPDPPGPPEHVYGAPNNQLLGVSKMGIKGRTTIFQVGPKTEAGSCSTNTHQHTHLDGCGRAPAHGPRPVASGGAGSLGNRAAAPLPCNQCWPTVTSQVPTVTSQPPARWAMTSLMLGVAGGVWLRLGVALRPMQVLHTCMRGCTVNGAAVGHACGQ